MLELLAKFLVFTILVSGTITSTIIDTNIILMLTRKESARKHMVLLDPMVGFLLLFAVSVSIYWWLHA